MATQQPTSTEQKKSEGEKQVEVTRTGAQGVERYRPRGWFNLPRFMRRGFLSPYESMSMDMSGNPFEVMRRMADDLDRMVAEFGFPSEGTPFYAETVTPWSPDVEVFQRGDDLIVRADLPGVNKEDIRVEVVDNNLVIEGERRHELERKGAGYYRSERSYGSFRRTMPLPETAREAEPTATYDAGVLEIRVKNPQTRGKRIEIKGGEAPKIH